ncbi:MAG TPA: SRPBCC family protein [Candidatus Saccharimonadales bacterium]|nr:SRPBCC family protein [Candidatus Saccharimonadales bacterium]
MTSDQSLMMKVGVGLGLAGLALVMIRNGTYGLTLFVVLPVAAGALGGWIWKPKSAKNAALIGMAVNAIASLAFLGLGFEGVICIGMALPLALPLGALGAWSVYASANKRSLRRGTATMMLLPLTLGALGFDATAKPDTFEVRSSIEIAAPPDRVWKNVVSFSELPPPSEWIFKAGVAYPIRARIEGAGPGAVRYCEFSTGPFVEPIKVWDAPHLLRFSVTQNPAPMIEWSPYAKIMPRHLHGYLVSEQGQFLLTPLPSGHTLLEGTTWYQHGLWPELYWTAWSQAIIHRIHMRVLRHIKDLSEAER